MSGWKEKMNGASVTPKNSESSINKEKKSNFLWNWISNLSLETSSDKSKFLITFVIFGLSLIIFGDLLGLATLQGSKVAFHIVGYLLIAFGILCPIFKSVDQ